MEVWKTKPRAPQSATHGYQLSHFALQLNNEVPKQERQRVAPTDSRFRSDIRAYEVGDFKKADQLRTKLREKNVRRSWLKILVHLLWLMIPYYPSIFTPQDMITGTYTPRWFKKYRDPTTKEHMYAFTNQYWSHKNTQDWRGSPSLF